MAQPTPTFSSAKYAVIPRRPAQPMNSRWRGAGSRFSRRLCTVRPSSTAATTKRRAPTVIGGISASVTFVTANELLQISAAARTAATERPRPRRSGLLSEVVGPGSVGLATDKKALQRFPQARSKVRFTVDIDGTNAASVELNSAD
ncbi:hypothetical protein I6J71_10875 [Amycolatopsis sp. FDAARGOS 1241]|nr:hypothetical protein I6J71_10875 [Amycolatopsis sp. FDAARGOS 1241]